MRGEDRDRRHESLNHGADPSWKAGNIPEPLRRTNNGREQLVTVGMRETLLDQGLIR